MTETERVTGVAALRAIHSEAVEEWLWHEQTDDTLAGWGAHMGQMLYRLPRDGQTRDMEASIVGLVEALGSALDALEAATTEPR